MILASGDGSSIYEDSASISDNRLSMWGYSPYSFSLFHEFAFPIWRSKTGSSYIFASNQDFKKIERLGI